MNKIFRSIVLYILISASTVSGQLTPNSDCARNDTAVRLEGRSCTNSCETFRCISRNAICLCDGSCGRSCITKGLMCEKPKKLINGTVTIHGGRKFRDEVSYMCDDGFELIGPNKRICQGDQLWSGNTPFCTPEGIRCSKPNFDIPDSDSEADFSSNEFYIGDSVSYSCSVGFVQTVWAIRTTKCELSSTGDAVWTPNITLKCEVIKCSYPDRISNGYYEGNDFSFGQLVTYYCYEGYTLKGTADRICSASGQWSGDPPECEAKTVYDKCVFTIPEHVRAVMDGQQINDQTIEVPDQSILKLRCNNISEFFFDGDNILKCDKGNWNGTIPTCYRLSIKKKNSPPIIQYDITEGKLNIDDDGSLNVTEGATLRLHCMYFQLNMSNIKWISSSKTQMIDKAWTSNYEAHELILSPISHMHESKYSCCINQELCNSIKIKVTNKRCERLLAPENGFINFVLNRTVNSMAFFTCLPGYELIGKENTTCLWIADDLQWSNTIPKCIKTTGEMCKALSLWYDESIKYNTKPHVKSFWIFSFGTKYEHGTTATVNCKSGYEIFPLNPIVTTTANTICENGKWKPDISNCIPARCSCRELPQEMIERKRKFQKCIGIVPSKSYNILTECEEGYTAKINYAARCYMGKWSFDSTEQQNNKCNQMKTTDCHLDLRGKTDLLAIQGDRAFTEQAIDFINGSLIKFICKTFHYKLEGKNNATCISGQWTEEIPKCGQTSGSDKQLPPLLSFYANNTSVNRTSADDGRIVLPKQRYLVIHCWTPRKRQLSLTELNTVNQQFIKVKPTTHYGLLSTLEIEPVKQMTEAIVKCESFGKSTVFNLVISDTCQVDEDELNKRGLQVVLNSKQRTYVEGDIINLECSSNNQRTNQFMMTCRSDRKWIYTNHTLCANVQI